MPPLVARMLFIFALTFVINSIRRISASRPLKDKIEMPGKGQRIGLSVQVALTYFTAFMAFLGFIMRGTEMVIMFAVTTLIFATIVYFTRRKFKRMYEETEDSFILKNEYWVYEVDYENIIDWVPLPKQIGVLDKTREEKYYICVNLAFSDSELLLEKLAEMTFAGKFQKADDIESDDPNREQEFIDHLQKNGYGYIVEDYIVE